MNYPTTKADCKNAILCTYIIITTVSTESPLFLLFFSMQVHPSHDYFAVGEKGDSPVIAIYSFPSLKLYRVLRGGTEQQYSHMDFSPQEGTLLASVGGYPDYMLTVWDWEKESIVLRSKAFSQEIYRVSFSPELPGQLTTSGTGHIRFWKMASTFTGLKLQGYLGKFGQTELTDIAGNMHVCSNGCSSLKLSSMNHLKLKVIVFKSHYLFRKVHYNIHV